MQPADFWKFVTENAKADPAALRLKYHGRTTKTQPGTDTQPFDYPPAITQIECRRKFGKKLAQTLAENPQFIFPSALAGEQSTSDMLAAYHASLIRPADKVVDLTAGLGIDAMHLAKTASHVTAIERDSERAEALRENTQNIKNLDVVCADCRDWLKDCPDRAYDVAFIDPARRAADGSRVFALSDCQPSVTEMLPDIQRIARILIVKASPMLDITKLIGDLPHTHRLISLGTPTECKELVAIVDFQTETAEPEIAAVTLPASPDITFTRQEEASASATYAAIADGQFLLEPYPAVMKAGPFNLLSSRYGAWKVCPNTQLYFSDSPIATFPGECFEIKAIIPYESKYIKRIKSTYPTLLVATRNFDLSAEALRKKLGVKDGGDLRLIALTAQSGQKLMIVCKKQP